MAPKAAVTAVAKKATVSTAKPTGLQLSAAQWKAYNAAYTASASAAYRALAIKTAAQSLRQSRLSAAYSLAKKAAAAHAVARTAAIAAFAVATSFRQSQLAHQNVALQSRVFADYERHIQAAARAQYVYKGEKAYAHEAVMRTLTTAQATSVEQVRFAQAAKTAKKAVSSVQAPTPNAQSAAALATATISANAKAAALAAARATPVGRTAPRPEGAAAAESWQEAPWCGAWRGDPNGYDCVAAAVANHLLYSRRFFLAQGRYETIVQAAGTAPELSQALERVSLRLLPGFPARLTGHRSVDYAVDGTVIGFTTARGRHAALYLGLGLIASWGEVLNLDDVITQETAVEEVWQLTWTVG